MNVVYVLLSIIAIIGIFLIYKRIDTLVKMIVDYCNIINIMEENHISRTADITMLLRKINKKITELSDNSTVNNPAWGSSSSKNIKKESSINQYADYLAEKENISSEDALCKATFMLNNLHGEYIIDEINRELEKASAVESEARLQSSDLFKKELKEKSEKLQPKEVFEPLYVGIVKKQYKKGDKLSKTRRSFDYIGETGYKHFIEDTAIIYKLEQLGLLKKDHDYDFILNESDINKIRHIIFKDNNKDTDFFDDLCMEFDNKYSHDDKIKLPFRKWCEFPY